MELFSCIVSLVDSIPLNGCFISDVLEYHNSVNLCFSHVTFLRRWILFMYVESMNIINTHNLFFRFCVLCCFCLLCQCCQTFHLIIIQDDITLLFGRYLVDIYFKLVDIWSIYVDHVQHPCW